MHFMLRESVCVCSVLLTLFQIFTVILPIYCKLFEPKWRFTLNNSALHPYIVFMCFVRSCNKISTISLHGIKCVFCAVLSGCSCAVQAQNTNIYFRSCTSDAALCECVETWEADLIKIRTSLLLTERPIKQTLTLHEHFRYQRAQLFWLKILAVCWDNSDMFRSYISCKYFQTMWQRAKNIFKTCTTNISNLMAGFHDLMKVEMNA